MFNLEGLIPKICNLAQDMGNDGRTLQLRCAGLQALSSTVSSLFFCIHNIPIVCLIVCESCFVVFSQRILSPD